MGEIKQVGFNVQGLKLIVMKGVPFLFNNFHYGIAVKENTIRTDFTIDMDNNYTLKPNDTAK